MLDDFQLNILVKLKETSNKKISPLIINSKFARIQYLEIEKNEGLIHEI